MCAVHTGRLETALHILLHCFTIKTDLLFLRQVWVRDISSTFCGTGLGIRYLQYYSDLVGVNPLRDSLHDNGTSCVIAARCTMNVGALPFKHESTRTGCLISGKCQTPDTDDECWSYIGVVSKNRQWHISRHPRSRRMLNEACIMATCWTLLGAKQAASCLAQREAQTTGAQVSVTVSRYTGTISSDP